MTNLLFLKILWVDGISDGSANFFWSHCCSSSQMAAGSGTSKVGSAGPLGCLSLPPHLLSGLFPLQVVFPTEFLLDGSELPVVQK